MSIWLVEGEQTVKQRVLFLVDGCSKFDASVQCRNGIVIKKFVLEETQESKPTNFKHLCTLNEENIGIKGLEEVLNAKVYRKRK